MINSSIQIWHNNFYYDDRNVHVSFVLLTNSQQICQWMLTFVWISKLTYFFFFLNQLTICNRTKKDEKKTYVHFLRLKKEMQFNNCNIGINWQWVHSIVTTVVIIQWLRCWKEKTSNKSHQMSKWNGRTSFILQYFTAPVDKVDITISLTIMRTL